MPPLIKKHHFFLIWLINPFISTLLLFKDFKGKSTIFPYLLISFFFGCSFVISEDSTSDSVRYSSELKILFENQPSFQTYISNLYSNKNSKIDLYQPLVTFFVSKFTSNYKWLFAIYSLVFGYFWFRSIRLARSLLPEKLSFFLLLILILFALQNPVWNINGVRMWTAIGMFFYGLLLLNFSENKKGYIFLILSIFTHFSLVLALAVFLVYTLWPIKSIRIAFLTYILSLFLAELDLDLVRKYFEQLPEFMQSRSSYLSDEVVSRYQTGNQTNSTHIIVYRKLLKWLMIVLVNWMFFSFYTKKYDNKSNRHNFFLLTIFYSIFSNIIINLPSGLRFQILSNLLILFCFIWHISFNENQFFSGITRKIFLIMMTIVIVVQIRIGLDYFGISFFLGNAPLNIFLEQDTPIINFIKDLFE